MRHQERTLTHLLYNCTTYTGLLGCPMQVDNETYVAYASRSVLLFRLRCDSAPCAQPNLKPQDNDRDSVRQVSGTFITPGTTITVHFCVEQGTVAHSQ